jgi:hypothetical protein
VWARNEFTGEEGFKPVVRLFRNTADAVVHLTYRREAGTSRRGMAAKGGGAEDGEDEPATLTGTTSLAKQCFARVRLLRKPPVLEPDPR